MACECCEEVVAPWHDPASDRPSEVVEHEPEAMGAASRDPASDRPSEAVEREPEAQRDVAEREQVARRDLVV